MSSFDRIFRTYYRSMVIYALKFVKDEEIAVDLVQDVFTKVWEKKKAKLEEEHLKAYLFSSVRNSCLNYLKHERVISQYQNQQMSTLLDIELRHYETGEKSLIEKENLEKIYKAIGSLSEIHREVIELSRFEGLKNREISQRLNIPVRTVETRLFRALSTLRKKLSEKVFHILMSFCRLKHP